MVGKTKRQSWQGCDDSVINTDKMSIIFHHMDWVTFEVIYVRLDPTRCVPWYFSLSRHTRWANTVTQRLRNDSPWVLYPMLPVVAVSVSRTRWHALGGAGVTAVTIWRPAQSNVLPAPTNQAVHMILGTGAPRREEPFGCAHIRAWCKWCIC